MTYGAYLLCLVLVTPGVAMGAVALLIANKRESFLGAIAEVLNILFFFLPGLADPAQEGWRIGVWLAAVAILLGIGAIRALKTLVFWGLGIIGTVGIAVCLFAASRSGLGEAFAAALMLSPSIAGVAACMWFTVKYERV